MYRMDKLTTGAAYGASAGSILNGMLNAYSPEQWNAIGVLGRLTTTATTPSSTKGSAIKLANN